MRTETIKKTYYTFEELPEDIQEKALYNLCDINVDHGWWDFDGLMDLTEKERKARHMGKMEHKSPFSWQDIWFDIDRYWHLEFSGMMFDDSETARRFLRIPKDLWEACRVHFTSTGGRHSTTTIDFDGDYYGERDYTARENAILDRAKEIFDDKVQDALRILRDEYEYQTSPEAIKETILANEYEFDEDGNLV